MNLPGSSDLEGDANRIRLDWRILAAGLKDRCSCVAA